jgi:hypothetical protein
MTTKEYKTQNRMIFVEWITTIAVFISCFGYLSHKIDKQCERTDKLYEVFCVQSQAQSERTDKLYEMFIDLLKESNKK